MKCDICEKEVSKTIPFYWGFFKTNYEKEKWINACENCTRKFQQASHLYKIDRTKLQEKKIPNKYHNIFYLIPLSSIETFIFLILETKYL